MRRGWGSENLTVCGADMLHPHCTTPTIPVQIISPFFLNCLRLDTQSVKREHYAQT